MIRPVRNDRPAVVPARPDDVELVAAQRTVLHFPELAGLGMDDQAQRIAEAQGVDLRSIGRVADEGIVFGRGPVVIQAQDLAGVTAGFLGLLRRADAIAATVLLVAQRHADRHEDPAVGGEDQSGHAEAADPGVRYEDVLDVGQGVGAVEAAAPQHRRSREPLRHPRVRRPLLARLGLQVREVDQAVFGELRMHRHVPQAQPAAVDVVHLGHAADRFGIQHPVADDAQAARALGDQDVAVRQEVHGRRTEKALDGDDTELLVAEAQDPRLVGQGVRADPPASLLRVADGDEQAQREDDEERGRPSRRACAL